MTEPRETKYLHAAREHIRECLPFAKSCSESLGRSVMTKQEEIKEESFPPPFGFGVVKDIPLGVIMTKQDYVQKYLEDMLADAWRKGAHKQGIDVTEEADKAQFHLTKWGVVIKVKCPDCEWSQFEGEASVGMTPCYHCNSTGYIIEPLIKEDRI